MAKSRRKEKFKRKDKRGAVSTGIARRTLSAARFFFDQARRVESHNAEHYGYYVEAAVVFAWTVLEHLESEFPGAKEWIRNFEKNRPLIGDLKNKRNFFSHQRPISRTPSQEDIFHFDESSKAAHDMLGDQLDEIGIIVEECEKLFK